MLIKDEVDLLVYSKHKNKKKERKNIIGTSLFLSVLFFMMMIPVASTSSLNDNSSLQQESSNIILSRDTENIVQRDYNAKDDLSPDEEYKGIPDEPVFYMKECSRLSYIY